MHNATLANLIEMLRHFNDSVQQLESEAKSHLKEPCDSRKYQEKLELRAGRIICLPDEITSYLPGLSPDMAEMVVKYIDELSQDAMQAKEIGSVFYMSCLLYPLDHKAGDPNELEMLIDKLRALAK